MVQARVEPFEVSLIYVADTSLITKPFDALARPDPTSIGNIGNTSKTLVYFAMNNMIIKRSM